MPETQNTVVESSPTTLTSETKAAWNAAVNKTSAPPTPAAPSPAPKETEVVTPPEDSTTSSGAEGQKPEAEAAAAPEAVTKQEPKRGNAETRLKELLEERKTERAEMATLRSEMAELRKQASQPAKPAEAQKPEAQYTRPKPTQDDKNADGTPKYSTYDDLYGAVAKWEAEQMLEDYKRQQVVEAQTKEMKSRLDAARERYSSDPEAVKKIVDTNDRFWKDQQIPTVITTMLGDSDIMPDVLYVLSGELDSFIELTKSQPGKAIRKLAILEHETRLELEKSKAPTEVVTTEKKAPVLKEPAPKVPAEVGGRNTSPDDAVVAAAQGGFTSKTKQKWDAEFAARHR